MHRSKIRVAAIVAIVLVLCLGGILWWTTRTPTALPSPTPAPTLTRTPTPSITPSPSPSLPSPSPTVPAAWKDCTDPAQAFTPTSFAIERVGAHERVLSLASEGNQIPSPPKRDRRSAGWWNEGPKPGSPHGKVVLTIHTYRPSLKPALGNELFSGGKSALRPGDLLKLYGKDGEIACYEFTQAQRVMVDEYDPASHLMYDLDGPSSAVIVICWDFDKHTEEWDSRVFFQFKQVTNGS